MNSSKDSTKLNILQSGRIAGHLFRTDKGCRFEYSKDYLSDTLTSGIAFNLPKRAEPYEVQGYNLHPFFAGLLPEGLRLRALVKGLKTSEDDLFSLFAALGNSCVGDISPEDPSPQHEESLPKLKELSFEKYFTQLLKRPLARIQGNDTFSGVQDKVSGAVISMPLNVARHTKAYLLKLNSKDFPNIVRNEHACLVMAKKCGFRVNSSKIIYDKDRQEGLLITRFDRAWNESLGKFEQIHIEDACQFLDLYPSEKYRVSLRQVAEGIQKFSDTPQIDVLELISQYLFSYLIGNGDLHAKNISLLRDASSGRVLLSPTYDLVCTLLYPFDQSMALKIEGRDKNFTSKTFIQFASHFQLSEKIIRSHFKKILQRFIRFKADFFTNISPAIQDDKKQRKFEREVNRRLKEIADTLKGRR